MFSLYIFHNLDDLVRYNFRLLQDNFSIFFPVMRIIVYLASVYNLRKYYYGYNYALARVLMNAIGSGQYRCRRVATGAKPNHARSRNYIRLTDNCVKWKLQGTEASNRDWTIVSIAYRHFG